jgi:predicted 3-demethylubiquinone-9 3-methyltransferase (glyoxalase superfamily)
MTNGRERKGKIIMKQKIVPFLWFDKQAEDAANFYVSVFDDSRIIHVSHYGEASAKASGLPEGSILTVEFELMGQKFIALNGGPVFKFTPAISFMVECGTQKQIDHLWKSLSFVPKAEQCGWLQDKYGVSWQIVPASLGRMMKARDPARTERVMQALMPMKKLDKKVLEKAFRQVRELA